MRDDRSASLAAGDADDNDGFCVLKPRADDDDDEEGEIRSERVVAGRICDLLHAFCHPPVPVHRLKLGVAMNGKETSGVVRHDATDGVRMALGASANHRDVPAAVNAATADNDDDDDDDDELRVRSRRAVAASMAAAL